MSVRRPNPTQLKARTPTIVAPLATPYVVPATVPEQCDPCPLQSMPYFRRNKGEINGAFILQMDFFFIQISADDNDEADQ